MDFNTIYHDLLIKVIDWIMINMMIFYANRQTVNIFTFAGLRHPGPVQRQNCGPGVCPHEETQAGKLQGHVCRPGHEMPGRDRQKPRPNNHRHGLRGDNNSVYLTYIPYYFYEMGLYEIVENNIKKKQKFITFTESGDQGDPGCVRSGGDRGPRVLLPHVPGGVAKHSEGLNKLVLTLFLLYR